MHVCPNRDTMCLRGKGTRAFHPTSRPLETNHRCRCHGCPRPPIVLRKGIEKEINGIVVLNLLTMRQSVSVEILLLERIPETHLRVESRMI
mmetsp:Transcript_27908/g.54378  ORF Transcript_27908/g.54378 Transcript_27908/m.54378 type:complete len:91 (-) Transcript_27908:126-398(-)